MGSVLPVSRKRQYVILVFFSVWALALCGMLFYYTIARGEELRAESRLLAWREGLMDAVRGSIFASDGTLLAWTELHYDLVLDPHKLKYDSRALSAVEKMFGGRMNRIERGVEYPFVLVRALRIAELKTVNDVLLPRYPELSIRPRFARMRVDYAEVRELIGECGTTHENLMCGVSGLEKKYDSVLSGVPCRYKVMLDAKGRWFGGTLKILSSGSAGKDVTLEQDLETLKNGGGNDD